jgi:hypothetical protein
VYGKWPCVEKRHSCTGPIRIEMAERKKQIIPFTCVASNLHKIFLTLPDIDFVSEVPEFTVETSKILVLRKNTCNVYSYEKLLQFLYLTIIFIERHGFLKGQQSTALLNTAL